jgi:hypothetical protein
MGRRANGRAANPAAPHANKAGNPDTPADVGKARRSQAATTYGPGTLVDFGKGCFVVLGIDNWDAKRCTSKSEPRLERILKKDCFRLPPVRDSDSENNPTAAALPVRRFPKWYTCGKCSRLGEAGFDGVFPPDAKGNLTCDQTDECKSSIRTPVRFIICCEAGHMDEFPWYSWVHRDGSCTGNLQRLKLESTGKSSELKDLFVVCERCKKRRDLGDAFIQKVMETYNCQGKKHWLPGDEFVHGCDKPVRTLLRGGSNLYFPVDASALSIPPFSSQFYERYERNSDSLLYGDTDATLRMIAKMVGADFSVVQADYQAYKQGLNELSEDQTEEELRLQEYQVLSTTHPDPTGDFSNLSAPAEAELATWFNSVGQVSRLREMRVRVAFSRINPVSVRTEDIRERIAEGELLSVAGSANPNWLPAIEIRGEGVFLNFRNDAIRKWLEENPGLRLRGEDLLRSARNSTFPVICGDTVEAMLKDTMIHSFAHALIRQISLECGYNMASLRERLYLTENYNGVLIYTGTPDSEGSLGGLVRMGRSEKIRDLVLSTIEASRWCGSDPVCSETDPKVMGDRISGASCHSCLLLPETSCEKFNKFLDRTLLVGHPDGKWKGFFG